MTAARCKASHTGYHVFVPGPKKRRDHGLLRCKACGIGPDQVKENVVKKVHCPNCGIVEDPHTCPKTKEKPSAPEQPSRRDPADRPARKDKPAERATHDGEEAGGEG